MAQKDTGEAYRRGKAKQNNEVRKSELINS